MVTRGVAKKFILGIAERTRLSGLIPRAEKRRHDANDVDELTGGENREGAENQGVDQRERSRAGANGQGQGRNRRETRCPVLDDHAYAEAEIAKEGFEPHSGLNVLAGFAELERVTQLPAREAFGFDAGHAAADQIVYALADVKLEFALEIGGGASGAKGVDDL